MLTRKRAYRLLIAAITFLLGTTFEFLLAQWLPSRDVELLSIMIIIISLVLILVISSDILSAMESVIDLEGRSGIRVEYIEDESTGWSYQRASELIKNAKKRITIVSPWEPFSEYQGNDTFPKIRNNRFDYYEKLIKQIDTHTHDKLFHKRIIQIPREHEGKSLVFKTDSTFYKYLNHAAEVQSRYPRSCHLKRSGTFIHIHFTIIDERYVLIPIFTTAENNRLVRHGVLIFDDKHGDLVKGLNDIYETLDAKSQPIESSQLIAPPNEK